MTEVVGTARLGRRTKDLVKRLRPGDLAIITAICVITALIMWIAFRSSGPIARRLGPIGMNIVTRVMGILVTATAFGLLGRGIGGLLPGLAK